MRPRGDNNDSVAGVGDSASAIVQASKQQQIILLRQRAYLEPPATFPHVRRTISQRSPWPCQGMPSCLGRTWQRSIPDIQTRRVLEHPPRTLASRMFSTGTAQPGMRCSSSGGLRQSHKQGARLRAAEPPTRTCSESLLTPKRLQAPAASATLRSLHTPLHAEGVRMRPPWKSTQRRRRAATFALRTEAINAPLPAHMRHDAPRADSRHSAKGKWRGVGESLSKGTVARACIFITVWVLLFSCSVAGLRRRP